MGMPYAAGASIAPGSAPAGRRFRISIWRVAALALLWLAAAPAWAQEPCPVIQAEPPGEESLAGEPVAPADGELESVCPPLPPDGGISANPTQCTIAAGASTCSSSINWWSRDAETVEVWARPRNGQAAQLLSTSASGTLPVAVTAPGVDYQQRLNGNDWLSAAVTTNFAPTVTLTAPANGATFTAPASIALAASASDSDGTINKVEFFNGATLLGTDTTSPYSFTWNNVAAGSYSLTARATDNLGAQTTSVPVSITVNAPNQPPSASLTAPADGAVFPPGQGITLSASASDSDGTISKVEFFDGSTLLATDTTSPYSFNWTGASIGAHTLTAKATDNGGAQTTSAPRTIRVNSPPNVSLTGPASGATLDSAQVIPLAASASDSDGTISKVEFFDGSTLLATDTTSPYSFNWSGAAVGSHTLTAKATDNDGAVTTSPPVTVTVHRVKLTATNKLVASVATTPATASTTFRLAAAGKIRFQTAVGGAFVEQAPFDEWLEPESGAASANYEVWAQPVSGTVSAGAVNQWLALSSARDWTLTRASAGTSQAVVNLRIRRIGTTAVLAAADVTLKATVNEAPNEPPSVSLTCPTGTVFQPGQAISLAATASDSDGTIAKVEFFNGGTLLATDTTSPYGFTWSNAAIGTHTLTAKATDDKGASSLPSNQCTIRVNSPPMVSLTGPANGATFTAPASITLTASASDDDGSISKVEFFNGGTLLATDTTSPYSFAWNDVAAGSYSLTAKATDNDGAATTSTAVTIQVLDPAPCFTIPPRPAGAP